MRESERSTMITVEERRMFLKQLNDGKKEKIVLKNGSNKLYFDFQYNGRQEKTTGLSFSVDNAVKARNILDEITEEILSGTFCFAARFPNASLVSKTLHTQQERGSAKKRHDRTTIREFIEGTQECKGWIEEILPTFPASQQKDYLRDINFWLLPLYGEMTFADLTGYALHLSLRKYTRHRKENGVPLSGIRIKNIFIPLRMIWNSAASKYGWKKVLDNPFDYLKENKVGPKREENPTRALLFKEYKSIRQHLDEYNYHIAEITALTGMIDSERAGLRKKDIFFECAEPYLHICNKIVNGIESEELKTEFRNRKMYITKRIREELDYFMVNSPDEYVFTQPDGTRFKGEDFRKAWAKAMKTAKIDYERPYCLRHSYAGWSKIIDIQLSWLQDMMGHSTLEMLYKRYGRHRFGLEDDRESIITFFGVDYLRLGNASPVTSIAKVAKADEHTPKSTNKKAA